MGALAVDLFPGELSTDGLEYDKFGGMKSKEIDVDERLNGGREDEESDSSAKEIQEDGKKENISLKRIKNANVSHRTTELEI